jgi:eukaryotic-like serine/threonine-protein kinase
MPIHSGSPIGKQIGNYRLVRLLGQGGFADVYIAEHIFLKTQAAIKLLNLSLESDNIDTFLQEAQTIAKLRHPHIVHVFECGIDNGIPFLVMDYIPNGTLRQRHPKGSRLLPEQIVPYVQQITSALYYAHQQKLIHRDVKPENMLLGQNGEVLLSDFGLALVAQSSASQSIQEMAGTISYMAPEQLQGRPRIASDQYALGVVIYEWLCGERPFEGSIFEVMSQQMLVPPPSLRQKVPELSPDLEQVVLKAL